MILYYQRRLHRTFVGNHYENDFTGDFIRVPSYNTEPGCVNPPNEYPYYDLKMCEVQSRKEAFHEINLFMEVNGLHTDNTSVFKGFNGDNDTYIVLWEDRNGVSGELPIVACFVLSNENRIAHGYQLGYGTLYARKPVYDVDVDDPEPDVFYRRYINSKNGLYSCDERRINVKQNEDGTYGWFNNCNNGGSE